MNARLRITEWLTWTTWTVELPAVSSFVIGRGCGDFAISTREVPVELVKLLRLDGAWGHEQRTLRHGDSFTREGYVFTFLDAPEAVHAELEARLDGSPDDEGLIHVWADWLQEQGDPFGEHLLSPRPKLWVAGGLVRAPHVELHWRNGLLHTATLRRCETGSPAGPLAMLLTLRAARWLRSLTVDCAGPDVAGHMRDTNTAAHLLLRAPVFPALEHLSFGYTTEHFDSPGLMQHTFARLKEKYPRLKNDPAQFLTPASHATLEVAHVPDGLDFVAPHVRDGHQTLRQGAWAGSGSTGQLKLLPHGTRRSGIEECFVITHEENYVFEPIGTVRLNGLPARRPTRLLPGDLIETSHGAQFRFHVHRV